MAVRLDPVYIGQANGLSYYRVDLSQGGLKWISSITIQDDGVLSGSPGQYSGFDLDHVTLGGLTGDPAVALGLAQDGTFDFSTNGVVFQPGFQSGASTRPNLYGTSEGNLYDPFLSSPQVAGKGSFSLGESGKVTFLLTKTLDTAGQYLYLADSGGNEEGAYVLLSEAPAPAPSIFKLVGTARADKIKIGVGVNAHLKTFDVVVNGKAGDDVIGGGLGNDKLYGSSGKDTVSGGSGDDWIFGGLGNDVLKGGGGKDCFVFNSKPSSRTNYDRIVDFNSKADSFYMENRIYKELGKGTLDLPLKIKKSAFWKGSEAHDSNDRIIYDKMTGSLYYDPDGTGVAAQVQFATVKKGTALTYHDFMVI